MGRDNRLARLANDAYTPPTIGADNSLRSDDKVTESALYTLAGLVEALRLPAGADVNRVQDALRHLHAEDPRRQIWGRIAFHVSS